MTRTFASLLLFGATFVVPPLAAWATPITVPTGLNPGDQYRLAFVTSTTRDATSSDIADYNAFVSGVANSVPELVALGTTWKAIGSTSDVDARDNTSTNPLFTTGVAVYRLDDTLVATSNADLWDGSLAAPLFTTEFGTTTSTSVYTGTLASGVREPGYPLGEDFAMAGLSSISGGGWVHQSALTAIDPHSIYAISDVLTVAPEPSAMVLACLAVAGLAVSSLRKAGRGRGMAPLVDSITGLALAAFAWDLPTARMKPPERNRS